jgi:hypothetical protein
VRGAEFSLALAVSERREGDFDLLPVLEHPSDVGVVRTELSLLTSNLQ